MVHSPLGNPAFRCFLLVLAFVAVSLGSEPLGAEPLDCYPTCPRPVAAFQLADSASEYRAKRDAAREERRLIEAKRRDRKDREELARRNLRKLTDQLEDGGKKRSRSRRRKYHGSNDGQAGAHCMYGQDDKLIYAPRGTQCANEKGGALPGASTANPAVTQGCASGDCRSGEGTYVWSDGTRYTGGFKNGLQNGHGALAFANGASYVGRWEMGKRSGIGTAIFPDGRVKAGRWKDNRFLGDATATAATRLDEFVPDWPDLSRPAPKVGGGEKDVVVIVGIEDYAHVAPIPGAEQNAVDWYRYMVKTRGVPSDRVSLLLDADATREEIRIAAEEAARLVGKKGHLWFVFIGHGAPAPTGDDGLLIGFDAQQKARSLTSRSVERSDLIEVLESSRARQIHVVLDACFSGKSGDGAQLVAGLQPLVVTSTQPTSDKRTILMTAAQSDQFAGPLPGANRPAFSYLMLGGLRGWADEDGNGRVSAGELHDYAMKTMRSTIRGRRQTPTFIGKARLQVGRSPEETGPDVADLLVGTNDSESRPASRR